MSCSPRFIVQGVDTLFHLSTTTSVAVDYVDAAVFYFPPHEADELVVPVPGAPMLEMLSAPTLLVHKILATQDRPITEPVLRRTKQLADASDARFLVYKCLHTRQFIQPIHARRFQGDAQRVLAAFAAVARRVRVCGDQDFAAWNALASASGLGPEFKIVKSLRLKEQDQAQTKPGGRDIGL
ncbi:hypothetical protein PsYK624_041070 [Phanerochaete sordida]|uniref:Uncharacterized protein n=1 Tax=Phanerochaete sordida TaxID=48140 RepID=A0A9P3G5T0_9APHY|nr:hypothetical protein PsYK624_041070 [Phanerochaete sordida]